MTASWRSISDWRFTYVNSAAERMLGRAGGELIGKNYWEEYPAERRSGAR